MQSCEISITGLSHDGQGVGRLDDGQVVFVPDLLPGERALIRLERSSRRHLVAQVQQRLLDSPQRRRPPCILADHCGGCSLQHLSYAGQLASKQDAVRQAMQRIGQLQAPLAALVGSSSDLGYRNRAVIPLERDERGTLRAGFYRRGSHRIVNMNHCPVLDPRLDDLVAPLKADLDATGWPVDRHLISGGGLRHLALRVGHHSGEMLITLIASHGADAFDGLPDLAASWMERWPQVVGVLLNQQPKATNALFGPVTEVIAGREWLSEHFCSLRFQLGCDTFFQVNTPQAERVTELLLQALPQPNCQLIDAYCGVGAFSLPLAAAGHRVIGLEVHAGAVELARCNAQLNGLEQRARFEQGEVAQHLASLLPLCDAVLLDPPRKGLDAATRQALIDQPVQTLLYLSCDPATLARDLGALSQGPYALKSLQALDFFPNTSHTECLAVLSS
ncbi:MAG: 23S rRNA (uracil(1939)-C(5))-methyltransferase RlmD [Cyanobacteriota bacterium]|nr:23S rRNA (uracil(1939)-C(5))-methyltransferase RlmD [Cyanobacteriota bacterium]